MRTRLIRLLALSVFAVLLGCAHSVDYMRSVTFGLGTNATVRIADTLPSAGYYMFTVEFPGVDRKRFHKENWPLEIRVDLRVVVKTNGQTALLTNVSKLYFSNISDKRVLTAYRATAFSVAEPVNVDCIVQDLTPLPFHQVKLLLVRARPK